MVSLLARLGASELVNRGVLFSVGFVREDGRVKLLFEVNNWSDKLADELKKSHRYDIHKMIADSR